MSTKPSAEDDFQQQFILTEYVALQSKIERAVGDLFKIETVIPLSVAIFYTWLAKDGTRAGLFHSWLLWIPAILVLIGWLRQEIRYKYIGSIETYLTRVEELVYGNRDTGQPEGWERYYRRSGSPWNRHLRRCVWIALLVGCCVLAWKGGLLPEGR